MFVSHYEIREKEKESWREIIIQKYMCIFVIKYKSSRIHQTAKIRINIENPF